MLVMVCGSRGIYGLLIRVSLGSTTWEKNLDLSLKVKEIWLHINSSAPRYTWEHSWDIAMNKNVRSSSICNSLKVETTQCPPTVEGINYGTVIQWNTLQQWFSTVGSLDPQRVFGNVWRLFWLSQLSGRVGEMLLAPRGGGQECC